MQHYVLSARNIPSTITSITLSPLNDSKIRKKKVNNETGPSLKSIRLIQDMDKKCFCFTSGYIQDSYQYFITETKAIPIHKTVDENLYKAVRHIEKLVNKELQKEKKTHEKLIRPIYNQENGNAWFKLSKDVKVRNWDQTDYAPKVSGYGRYQFGIRAFYVYEGKHGETDYTHSVLFKIAEIRFDEVEPPTMFNDDVVDTERCPSTLGFTSSDSDDDDKEKESNKSSLTTDSPPTKKKVKEAKKRNKHRFTTDSIDSPPMKKTI